MTLSAFLLVLQAAAPYVAFPEPGLDDPAAYDAYTTRVYRDSHRNAVQIYIDGKTGRVVHVWADGLNESVGFTVRDAGAAFGEPAARVGATDGRRWLRYTLTLRGPRPVQIGHFLLGSMRIERDFGYAGKVREPLDAPPFVPAELARLAERLGQPYRDRLAPRVSLARGNARWTLRVAQPSLDGRNNLWLTLSADARSAPATVAGRVLTIRPRGGGPVELTVEIATDGPPLHPLARDAIFTDAFRRWADSMNDPRIEREIRGFELLSSREKLMAGLPNYATYFGRDMFMTALLMEPVWADTMAEFVLAAALAKLAPSGEVSHEEALGGQAIRENAEEFLRTGDSTLLRDLQRVRENYWMVDDDFQLAVVAGRYFGDAGVPPARKRDFVARWGAALRRNLAYVAAQAAPYTREPIATNLVGFRQDPPPDGWWHPGSWRDSRVGYAGGRYAFDVNVVWVPAALRATRTIDSVLKALGEPGVAHAEAIARSAAAWSETARHFMIALAPAEVAARVRARLAALPAAERAYWEAIGLPADTLRFPAVSLDSAGRPIPVMSTDPAMWLLLEDLGAERERELLRPFLLPYPAGLYVAGLGPLTGNDVYADSTVWAMFERDLYHSPRVVWGRDVNLVLAALARRGNAAAVDSIRTAVERSGFRHAELWSYRINGGLRPFRYGTGSDVQLWSLTDLAVQFLVARLSPPER